jgi:hypothetical protein
MYCYAYDENDGDDELRNEHPNEAYINNEWLNFLFVLSCRMLSNHWTTYKLFSEENFE